MTAALIDHYTSNNLLARLELALRADGIDPANPTLMDLAPYDQFHTRGIEATEEIAQLLPLKPSDHLLDLGSGLGGPARYFAHHSGCRVTGIDLTPEFCAVATHLTQLQQLQAQVRFDVGDATALPYAAASFNGVYSMNVSMNIRDKQQLYREIHRVLQAGGWVLLSELAQGTSGALAYPTPWADKADHSFLATPEETLDGLQAAGFEIIQRHQRLDAALDYSARSRLAVENGGKPLQRSVTLVHGDKAALATANTAEALKTGSLLPFEVLARRKA